MVSPVILHRFVKLVHIVVGILQYLLFGVLMFIGIGLEVGGIGHENTPAHHSVRDRLQYNFIEDILKDRGVFKACTAIPANRRMVRNFIG
ncbi:hypothetical protein D1872_192680 [compost metagenome]